MIKEKMIFGYMSSDVTFNKVFDVLNGVSGVDLHTLKRSEFIDESNVKIICMNIPGVLGEVMYFEYCIFERKDDKFDKIPHSGTGKDDLIVRVGAYIGDKVESGEFTIIKLLRAFGGYRVRPDGTCQYLEYRDPKKPLNLSPPYGQLHVVPPANTCGVLIDFDDSSVYPSPFFEKHLYKSKDNSRKERRLLRRASKRYGFLVNNISINPYTGKVKYFAKDPVNNGFVEDYTTVTL